MPFEVGCVFCDCVLELSAVELMGGVRVLVVGELLAIVPVAVPNPFWVVLDPSVGVLVSLAEFWFVVGAMYFPDIADPVEVAVLAPLTEEGALLLDVDASPVDPGITGVSWSCARGAARESDAAPKRSTSTPSAIPAPAAALNHRSRTLCRVLDVIGFSLNFRNGAFRIDSCVRAYRNASVSAARSVRARLRSAQ